MTIAEKLNVIAENMPRVYAAGQANASPPSSGITKTASGQFVKLEDVSEAPHQISVQLSSPLFENDPNGYENIRLITFKKNYFDSIEAFSLGGETNNPLVRTEDNTFIVSPKSNGVCYGIGIIYTEDNYIPIGKTVKCSVFSCSKIGRYYGWRIHHPDGSYTSLSQSLDFTYTTPKPVSKIYFYCDSGATDFTYEPVTIKYPVVSLEDETNMYLANPQGQVTFTSVFSPEMYLMVPYIDCQLNITYQRSEGYEKCYNQFWDTYQYFGKRTSYSDGFFGEGWNNTTFKPKYNIIPTGSCNRLFQYFEIVGDFTKILQKINITLDLSQITSFQHGFYCCSYLTRVGIIDLSGLTQNANYLFEDSKKLETVDKLVMPTSSTIPVYNGWFTRCASLKNITIEGSILKNLDIHWSTKLTRASLESIVTHLSDTVSGQTLTLPTTASTNYGDGWDGLIATKPNWTFAYL